MRVRALVAVLAIGTVGLVGSACSTTVDGSGSAVATSGAGATPLTPTPPTSSPSVSSPTATTGTSTAPSGSTPAPGSSALGCPPGSITARNAPFCYPLPAGFTDFSSQTGYGQGWTYRTLVSVDVHDLIEVFAAHYEDSAPLTDAQLRARFDRDSRLQVGKYGIVRAGTVSGARVDGARAFRQRGRYASGVDTDITTIYAGTTIASIQCQSLAHAGQVGTACATVRATIQLVSA